MISSRFGWITMEAVAAATFFVLFLLGRRDSNVVSVVFLLLWELHYINRAFIFPFRMKGNQKRMAISVVIMGLFFNTVNGWANGFNLFRILSPYPVAWFMNFRFISGVSLFLIGLVINIISDDLLRKQRSHGKGTYVMPEGFLFRWISCPNYFGEVIEWLGWALLTWSLAGLSFFIWTCANLIPRALTYHRWYRSHFPNYPEGRKAIFPFML
jgi:hypothetical protein